MQVLGCEGDGGDKSDGSVLGSRRVTRKEVPLDQESCKEEPSGMEGSTVGDGTLVSGLPS